MLFFDDESRNRNVERELGVQMILVPKGVSHSVFDRGVQAWRKRQKKSEEAIEEENDRIDEDEEGEWS
jgi:magnesium-dependent phosphatase 1